MKQNAMRNIALIIMFALACVAQARAVDYKGTYKGSRIQPTIGVATTATAPTVGFQSTSPYSTTFDTEQQPTLNADGTVNAEAYGVGANRPGMRKNSSVNPGTPGDEEEEEGEQQPLGDGLWILMVLAGVYVCSRKYARKVIK